MRNIFRKLNARKGAITPRSRGPAQSSGSARSVPGPGPGSRERSKAPAPRAQPPGGGGGPTCRGRPAGPCRGQSPGLLPEGTQPAGPVGSPAPTATARRLAARHDRQPGSAHLQPPDHVTAEPRPRGGVGWGIRKGTVWGRSRYTSVCPRIPQSLLSRRLQTC